MGRIRGAVLAVSAGLALAACSHAAHSLTPGEKASAQALKTNPAVVKAEGELGTCLGKAEHALRPYHTFKDCVKQDFPGKTTGRELVVCSLSAYVKNHGDNTAITNALTICAQNAEAGK